MKYLLNGGTHHINSASIPEILEYLRFMKVKNLIFIPFASSESSQSKWQQPEQLLPDSGFTRSVITSSKLDLAQARATMLGDYC